MGGTRILMGVAIGVGGAILLPRMLPALADATKPLFKAFIKASVLGIESAREIGAHLRESLEDAVAEVQSELSQRAESAQKRKHMDGDAARNAATAGSA